MEIELLYTKDCANYKSTKRLIQDTLEELKVKHTLKETEIRTIEEAEKHSFGGSPTVRINGKDIEPENRGEAAGLMCRIYANGTGMPDAEVLRFKIAQASGLKTVLFVCTGNSIRSQMAEALVNNLFDRQWAAFSAGILSTGVNPNAIKVMKEINIDISDKRAKHIDIFNNCTFDKVITLCSDADRICLVYPVATEKELMVFHDPLASFGFGVGSIVSFRNLRDKIKLKLLKYFKEQQYGSII